MNIYLNYTDLLKIPLDMEGEKRDCNFVRSDPVFSCVSNPDFLSDLKPDPQPSGLTTVCGWRVIATGEISRRRLGKIKTLGKEARGGKRSQKVTGKVSSYGLILC